jgi:hypothetical protein
MFIRGWCFHHQEHHRNSNPLLTATKHHFLNYFFFPPNSGSVGFITFNMGLTGKVSLPRPRDEPGKAWPAIAVGFFVAFGGVLFGFATSSLF